MRIPQVETQFESLVNLKDVKLRIPFASPKPGLRVLLI